MSESARPPGHLSLASQQWWRQIVEQYVLDAHHLRLLQLACESWDRKESARDVLESEGLTLMDRFAMPRARPEVAIERDSRLAFARLVRELALDVVEPEEARPPRGIGNAHRRVG